MLVACVILVLGIAGSAAGALIWRSDTHARERQTFQTSTANVSGTLEMLLRRDTDFVRSVRSVLTMQPDVTASRFSQWFAQLEDHQGQSGAFGALVVRAVPAPRLASFEAQRR